jgi:hypothetical protein
VITLLPTLVDHALSLQDRQHHLAQLQGLGADAARAHLANLTADRDVRVGVAWRRLEQARTVLLSQALETRTDTRALHTARPDLAAEYDHLRGPLNATPTPQ